MYNLDNVIYPGNILNKVVSFKPEAWDEITAHADRLFEEQKKLRYLETDDARFSNLFTRLKNFAVRSYNEAVKVQRDPYLRSVGLYASVGGRYGGSPQTMTSNMIEGLLIYVEQNRERLTQEAGVTDQDIIDLRIFVNWGRKAVGSAPAKNI